MEAKKYNSFEEAIRSFTIKDRDYAFVWHTLKPGEKIKPHYHKKADEWIVINNGIFTVKLGKEDKSFNLKNEVLRLHFPKKQLHSFVAETKVSYFVFRNCEDKTIYIRR